MSTTCAKPECQTTAGCQCDWLAKVHAAAEHLKTVDDSLLRAIGMLAASGHMTIVKNEMPFHRKAVIMLPAAMFDRMMELFPAPDSLPSTET